VKLGADPKKIAILGGLLLLALVLQFMGGDDRPSQPRPKTSAPAPSAETPVPSGSRTVTVQPARTTTRPNTNRRTQEFKPVVTPRRAEDRIDPAKIDPTLRLDLIARLSDVKVQGGNRPLFEFGTAPMPKAPDPGKIVPSKPVALVKPVEPPPPPVTTPVEPSKPQAPPIPLRFYGFTGNRAGGAKRGFFLENEDIFVANEGQLVKNRYKVVRINVNSVVMEDTQFSQQQTLPLVEQMQ
jgi:hypothetical protein